MLNTDFIRDTLVASNKFLLIDEQLYARVDNIKLSRLSGNAVEISFRAGETPVSTATIAVDKGLNPDDTIDLKFFGAGALIPMQMDPVR